MEKKQRRKQAAALRYDPQTDAVPILSAFGEGYMAERIVETAAAHGVPVTEDANLAAMLSKMSVGDNIPPQLYEVVARVLVFIGDVDKYYGAMK
jgi:flagellar biosynthesis protein